MQYYLKEDYRFIAKYISNDVKKRFCLFLFYLLAVTSPAQCSSQWASVENRPYKSEIHERLPSFRMANLSLQIHLGPKRIWVKWKNNLQNSPCKRLAVSYAKTKGKRFLELARDAAEENS